MDPIAVLSDIHGNLAAYQAVLNKISELGVRRIYCLGDTVGYGPQPVECLRLARTRHEVMLMGNHEYAVVHPIRHLFNPEAAKALDWTHEQLKAAGELESIGEMPLSFPEDNVLYVHGSVNDPLMEYVSETDDRGLSSFSAVAQDLEQAFTTFSLCFVGHNHLPFLATQEGFIHPHDAMMEFTVIDEKLYACVGSVGQPRDGDPRACFVVFTGDKICYHRVEYDKQLTADMIYASDLSDYLGDRLLTGS